LRITVTYLVVGLLWALLSDALPHKFLNGWPIINRVAFIAVTGALFYLLGRRYARALQARALVEHESVVTARAYLNSSPEGIVVIDRKGRIVEANQKIEHLFGYKREELVGRPIELLLPERFHGHHVGLRTRFFSAPHNGPAGAGADLAGRRKDGSEFPVKLSLSFLPIKDGGRVIGSVADMTEQTMIEREARRAETMAALGAVAAGIAHELNNPLAIISSRLELALATDADLPPRIREDLEVVYGTAQRASNILHDLLALASQQPKAWEPVNINELVERTLLLLGDQMRNDGIAVGINLDEALPPVLGDATALEQVLINLILNARDAMPDGGALEIRTEAVPSRPGWLRLAVKDNGYGIPSEAMPKLFNRFYTTKSKGTGLGLWLSQRIILQHRGNIGVQSAPGSGATFEVTLPITMENGKHPSRAGALSGSKDARQNPGDFSETE
jgi:PAS domain S-box-containing protein